jgi:hypothetical protein
LDDDDGGSLALRTLAFDGSDPRAVEIRALIKDQYRGRRRPTLDVHPDDDMFKFARDWTATNQLAVFSYFRAGIQIFETAREIVEWRFGSLDQVDSVCDFAAGYGRSTRFLAAAVDPAKVWAGEILPEAVDFQARAYGVNTITSTTDPADLRVDERFDVIFVSSLFSHLPERTFITWLQRLHGLLTDRGILVFSVHDEAVGPPDLVVGDSGIHFIPLTEVESLDVEDYGATIVTEAFVARMIAEATGSPSYKRLPRTLCFEQDLYVVARDGTLDESSDLAPRRGPHGVVDTVEVVEEGRSVSAHLVGWAVDLDDVERRPRIEIWVDGTRLGNVTTGGPRPDVAKYLGSSAAAHESSGWEATVALPKGTTNESLLLVKAVSSRGKEFALQCVTLGELVELTPPSQFGAARTAATLEALAHSIRTVGFAGTARRVPGALGRRTQRVLRGQERSAVQTS